VVRKITEKAGCIVIVSYSSLKMIVIINMY